jgi:hypothetical protein
VAFEVEQRPLLVEDTAPALVDPAHLAAARDDPVREHVDRVPGERLLDAVPHGVGIVGMDDAAEGRLAAQELLRPVAGQLERASAHVRDGPVARVLAAVDEAVQQVVDAHQVLRADVARAANQGREREGGGERAQ